MRGSTEVFVGVITALAVLAVPLTVRNAGPVFGSEPHQVLLFGSLFFLAELRPVSWMFGNVGTTVTMSWTFAFALLLLGAPVAALGIVLGASLVGDLAQRKQVSRLLFNTSQLALSLCAGVWVLRASADGGVVSSDHDLSALWGLFVALAGISILLVNGLLTTSVVAIHQRRHFRELLQDGVLGNMSTDLMLLGLAPAFVITAERSQLLALFLVMTTFAIYRTVVVSFEREFQASHDSLTELLNRRQFDQELDLAILSSARNNRGFALLLLDLDHFKEINDGLGHAMGDLVLQLTARELTGSTRPSDVLARLGGDEFGVILRGTNSAQSAAVVAQRFGNALRSINHIEGTPVSVAGCIGVAVYPTHGTDAETLMKSADIAMYQAKRTGGGVRIAVNTPTRDTGRALSLLPEIRRALADGQFRVHFQPYLHQASGLVVAAEALVRWEHPERGSIAPIEFIPIIEKTELIGPLTTFVLQEAVAQCARWRALGWNIRVSVNGAARSFHDIRFPAEIRRTLAAHDLHPSMLELEITENSVVTDPGLVGTVLDELRFLGASIAIDDFGTGSSSLTSLRQLPLDRIKIDKSFVQQITSNKHDRSIVSALIVLAHSLGLEAVAEGVEDEHVLRTLQDLGCDLIQGYHVSRPVPADVLTDLLSTTLRPALLEPRERLFVADRIRSLA